MSMIRQGRIETVMTTTIMTASSMSMTRAILKMMVKAPWQVKPIGPLTPAMTMTLMAVEMGHSKNGIV